MPSGVALLLPGILTLFVDSSLIGRERIVSGVTSPAPVAVDFDAGLQRMHVQPQVQFGGSGLVGQSPRGGELTEVGGAQSPGFVDASKCFFRQLTGPHGSLPG